ncbi:MAG: metallopeptidase family protein [Alphaproteobacteria bacterium]|nr:metallopeptidase family protein [Alphaproteobacteria bacterium]
MTSQKIIMHFSAPPTPDDLEVMAADALQNLPEELGTHCAELTLRIEEFPDEATEQELGLEDPYELAAFFKSGKEIAPGVQRKIATAEDVLILYRRPLLDMWCETQDDLGILIRQVMIEELGRCFEFTDDDIDEMTARHFQGML